MISGRQRQSWAIHPTAEKKFHVHPSGLPKIPILGLLDWLICEGLC